MASKPIAKRSIPCPLGTYYKEQWCPHAVQAALTADNNGALTVRVALIVADNGNDDEGLLVHPLGIALPWRLEEEELKVWCKVPLDEQDGVQCPHRTGYRSITIMY